MKLNPLFGSVKGKIIRGLFGGEDDPPVKKVYSSQAEIEAENERARRFARKAGHVMAENVTVNKRVGDPVIEFVTPQGKPYSPVPAGMKLATALPSGVKFDDVWAGDDGIYYFNHPNTGDATPVDIQFISSRYGKKRSPEEMQNDIAATKIRIANKKRTQ